MLRNRAAFTLAVATLGIAFSFNGCSCQAEMGTPPKSVSAASPPPAPPPPPAREPPPPRPVFQAQTFKAIGNAKIENNEIKIPGKLEFDVDQAMLRNDAGSTAILTTLVDVMKANPNVTKVRIEGHTDQSASVDYNKKLSQARADAIAKYLSDHGIDKSRTVAVGFGEEKPLVANDTPEHKQMNRRTEFHIVEIDGKLVPGETLMGKAASAGAASSGASVDTAAAAPTPTKGGSDAGAPPAIAAPAATVRLKPGDKVTKGR